MTAEAGMPARWTALTAGTVGAGSALAVGELFAGLSRRIPSMVVAVADVVIRQADADTAGTAIDLFGSNNKPALLVGIILVSLLLGAGATQASIRRPWVLTATYGSFGALGAWAAVRAPLSSAGMGMVSAALAALAGWQVTRRLLARALVSSSLVAPTSGLDRRRFLTGAVGVGAMAMVAAWVGRILRSNNTVESQRAEVAERLAASRPQARAVPTDSPTGSRLPGDVEGVSPYITPTADFYRIDTSAEVPQIDPGNWSMRIDGLVDRPLELTLDDLLGEELVETVVTISCVSNPVGGGYAGTATWTGVPLDRLFDRVGVQADASQVVGRSFTGWTGGFPLSAIGDGRTAMVAVGMNGEPLPVKHGFPARLIVAGLYGYVSATKWLSEIELTRWDDFDAYWVERSWAKEGPVKLASRIDVPGNGARQESGEIILAGVAWAPTVGIERVEVWLDAVGQWIPARLGDVVSDETWVQWSAAVEVSPGTHIARVRAVDGNGLVQPAESRPSFPDGAEGHHTIRFEAV